MPDAHYDIFVFKTFVVRLKDQTKLSRPLTLYDCMCDSLTHTTQQKFSIGLWNLSHWLTATLIISQN